MDDGKHCPACGKDIGVWPIFSAGLPNRIWCPHCSARLRYRVTTGLLLVIVALAIGLMAGALLFSWKYVGFDSPRWIVWFAGLMLLPWIVVELAKTDQIA
jgi:hypothetical protein